MKCPFCNVEDTKVVDSRLSKEGSIIRRRRECDGCVKRFTTYERVEEPLPAVVKKDGRRETFDRMKIFGGVKRACEKRPISIEIINDLVDRVERLAQDESTTEILSSSIGEKVMHELHLLDQVAYVRFASVYRSFKDIGEFLEEIRGMIESKK